MTPEEILSRLAEIESGFLAKGSPPRFAATKAYRQMLDELDSKGFKRFESIFRVFKAKELNNLK